MATTTGRSFRWMQHRGVAALVLATAVGLIGPAAPSAATVGHVKPRALSEVVPAPRSVRPASAVVFALTPAAKIYTQDDSAAAASIGRYLAGILRPSTGYALPVREAHGTSPVRGAITLLLTGADSSVGEQGYSLDITGRSVVLRAKRPAGLFAGVQTLRQLLPATIESSRVHSGPWLIAGGRIVDSPRFAYRGAMLDVSRHFFKLADVRRYIDEIALYKVNHLHLHLSDDQGWRIAINSWPRLATYGGSTAVGGGPGGYYTKDDYRAIVEYAKQRYITIVPEIDMPGHTNAALASYAQLNCDGVAPPLYTGVDVGFSSLCVNKEITYDFIDDVIGELAALTPGPYLHIGGDEAISTTPQDYATFINRAQRIVAAHGKTVIGWHDVVHATPLPSTIGQYWDTEPVNDDVAAATRNGTKLIMSPASRAYLDMKYTDSTPLGQDWAGLIEVKTAYGWDPGSFVAGASASSVIGVEAPLWTETLETLDHLEYMAFPRLPAIAELGWSPWSTHDWSSFQHRLGAQGPRWHVMNIDYYRSPQVSWPAGS